MRRSVALALFFAAACCLPADPAAAQSLSLDLGEGGGAATGRIVQLIALLSVLSLAPSILVMVTSFTRIIVVLSFVRMALGTQQTPPNQVLISLALFLTLFVMTPTLQQSYDDGIQPLIAGEIEEREAFKRTLDPIRAFMARHVRGEDLALLAELAEVEPAATAGADPVAEAPLRVLIPAFMISELRRAFEIGFLERIALHVNQGIPKSAAL